MNYVRYNRTHPRVYKKNMEDEDDKSIDLSIGMAVGILAVTFVKGIFWGYMIRRARD